MRHGRWLVVAAASLTGCFQVEQAIDLERDLSGTASFQMRIDMEPAAVAMAEMQRAFAGKTGAATAEEVAAARQQIQEQRDAEQGEKGPAEMRAEIAAKLPAGVRLIDADMANRGLETTFNFRLGFDEVSKLQAIRLDDEGEEGKQGQPDPFRDLNVVDQGETLLISSKALNPADGVRQQMAQDAPAMGNMEAFLKQAISGMRYEFRLKTPFQVVEHNATRVDGQTLVWSMGLVEIEKAAEVRVLLKK